MTLILDGHAVASAMLQKLKHAISHNTRSIKPKLAFILVGQHAASETYVGMKKKRCEEVGITSEVIRLEAHASEQALTARIEELNSDPSIHGILVQMPLPEQINPLSIMEAVDPRKDVDGFHPMNMGYLAIGSSRGLQPCTPAGIIHMLQYYNIPTLGKHAVIVGRSNIVGKPLALLLLHKAKFGNATVTVTHAHTQNLAGICQTADILLACAGSKHLIKKDFVKQGAVVIDVGIHKQIGPNNKTFLVGDVDYHDVFAKTSAITPVPGGVGPLTIAMLLENTWKSYCTLQEV